MAATSLKPASPAASVQALLASERDAHRRQRELVRASLMLCPAKTDPHAEPLPR
jgi:hypothetical protein